MVYGMGWYSPLFFFPSACPRWVKVLFPTLSRLPPPAMRKALLPSLVSRRSSGSLSCFNRRNGPTTPAWPELFFIISNFPPLSDVFDLENKPSTRHVTLQRDFFTRLLNFAEQSSRTRRTIGLWESPRPFYLFSSFNPSFFLYLIRRGAALLSRNSFDLKSLDALFSAPFFLCSRTPESVEKCEFLLSILGREDSVSFLVPV